jgi:heme-degrading monooxygenase HmoA
MILRIWHGWSKPENADAYAAMLRDEILPGIHRIPGYLGAYTLRKERGGEIEFVTITKWDSMKAVEEFAGPSKSGAVIYPKAHALLTRYDEHSENYEGEWIP